MHNKIELIDDSAHIQDFAGYFGVVIACSILTSVVIAGVSVVMPFVGL